MASDTKHVRGEEQKNLVKAFESLCGRHSRWEVWADWITASAIAISNTVDLVHREEREKTYSKIQEKYTAPEMQTMADMLALVVEGLDRNPDQDLLGDLFMRLELGNDHAGQFFTPYSVCKAMAGLNCPNLGEQVEEKGWVSVNDPACGAGALLVALANECVKQKINYQQSILFTGQDIDYTVGMMCYIQLSLLGCPGYVVIGDTLAHPMTAIDKRGLIPRDEGNVWYTPLYCMEVWSWRRTWAKADLLLSAGVPEREGEPKEKPQQPQKRASEPAKSRAEVKRQPEQKPAPQAQEFAENKYGQLVLF